MKWFQVSLLKTNHSIQQYSFISAELNGCKYSYVSLSIQLNISHLFTHSWMIKTVRFQAIQSNINHLLGHRQKVKVLFLAIWFNITHLFVHSLNVKSSIWPIDRTLSGATTPGQNGPRSNGNEGVLTGLTFD